jgi:hypothetical protein
MTGFRSGWNLPPGCTDRDIDEAAGAYDEPPPPTEAEELAEALYEAENVIRRALDLLSRDAVVPARIHLRKYLSWRK